MHTRGTEIDPKHFDRSQPLVKGDCGVIHDSNYTYVSVFVCAHTCI